ncbi:hypothetical protein KW782_03150 [Candidatus Parcubacteria bacterium]|nr:hypothetical protein [Candidatus Parcubacteria bacterium]
MISVHILLIILGLVGLWVSSGFIIAGVERFSKSVKISRFAVSFLLLGILTSIPEIAIGINSVIKGTPGIFVGNLIGASFVVLLFVIPLLAVFNRGIRLTQHLQQKRLLEFLLIISAPLLIIYDGSINYYEAFLLIFLYIVFAYSLESEESLKHSVSEQLYSQSKSLKSFIIIIIGALLIFVSSHVLTREVEYFSELLHVSSFMISMLFLSLGSNLPEIVIAIRSISQKKLDIAFGDYVGSAAANTLLFGIFTIFSGPFVLPTANFKIISLIMLIGYALFFICARSKRTISTREGLLLMLVFFIFIFFQAAQIIHISTL